MVFKYQDPSSKYESRGYRHKFIISANNRTYNAALFIPTAVKYQRVDPVCVSGGKSIDEPSVPKKSPNLPSVPTLPVPVAHFLNRAGHILQDQAVAHQVMAQRLERARASVPVSDTSATSGR